MLLLEIKDLKKYYGDRLILEIGGLNIYSGDRIGVVGVNGVGKTTLLNILSEKDRDYEGSVKLLGKHSFISQLESIGDSLPSDELISLFNIKNKSPKTMSGGELTRYKIACSLSNLSDFILADEPTSNLDINSTMLLESNFKAYNGSLIIISHDREFLDRCCNKILEIRNGKVNLYNGNYSEYVKQKEEEVNRSEFEFSQYIKEKKRLEEALKEKTQQVASMKTVPKRMGNSEARLHKLGNQKAQANLDRTANSIKSRIERLEVKEKPKAIDKIALDFHCDSLIHSKILIQGKVNKSFGERLIFKDADFKIFNGERTALIGENGCGKTTLIKMILNGEGGILKSKVLKVGYFSQDLGILNEECSVLKNVMDHSIYKEDFARLILARLLFKREDVYKKVKVLSGGEKVKVSFAKIILGDYNMIILDEPTNYLDIFSMEAIESVLSDYKGSLLFVSHDRRFLSKVATSILAVKDNKLISFKGSYNEYLKGFNRSAACKDKEKLELKMMLQNKLSELIGRLSIPSKGDDVKKLDLEYKETLSKLKDLEKAEV